MNLLALENVIKDKGLKKSFVADKMGISRQAFYLKLNGEREFSHSDMMRLKTILALSDREFMSIFFNGKVGKTTTQEA